MKTTLDVLNAPRHQRFFPLEQLRNERFELTAVPAFGCHWTRLRFRVKGEWVDFLRPVPDGDLLLDYKSGHGSYAMAPWSNRLADAKFRFRGEEHQLRKNFRDGTAIHGDVRTRPWTLLESEPERFEAELRTGDFADFNFPFAMRFRQRLALEGESLRVDFTTENLDSKPAPAGLGFHPFILRRLTWRDEDVMVQVPAEHVYPAAGCLPTGPARPVEGETDLRALRRVGAPNLDHCFTGLTDRELRIVYPGSRVEVRFTLDESFTHVVFYAPNTSNGQPTSFVAVEPVTNANNGFNLLDQGWEGTGVRVLAPGEKWTASWQISMGDV